MNIVLVYFHCVWGHWLLEMLFDRMACHLLRHRCWNIGVDFLFVCDMYSMVVFLCYWAECSCTEDCCMLTKFCWTVCFHKSEVNGIPVFLVWCCMKLSSIWAIIHSRGIMLVYHFVSVFNQPSTLGAQIRFVINLGHITRVGFSVESWFLCGKKNHLVSVWPSTALVFQCILFEIGRGNRRVAEWGATYLLTIHVYLLTIHVVEGGNTLKC